MCLYYRVNVMQRRALSHVLLLSAQYVLYIELLKSSKINSHDTIQILFQNQLTLFNHHLVPWWVGQTRPYLCCPFFCSVSQPFTFRVPSKLAFSGMLTKPESFWLGNRGFGPCEIPWIVAIWSRRALTKFSSRFWPTRGMERKGRGSFYS